MVKLDCLLSSVQNAFSVSIPIKDHVPELIYSPLPSTTGIAITADAFNNLSDAGSSIITYVGFYLSGKPADEDHPFGHERIEYISEVLAQAQYVIPEEEIEKEFGNPRRTEIRDEVTEIKFDAKDMIPKENVIVVATNEGYVKRIPLKSYVSSSGEPTTLKPGDFIRGLYSTTSLDTLLMFTNLGHYLYVPVHEIVETKWKELGKQSVSIV